MGCAYAMGTAMAMLAEAQHHVVSAKPASIEAGTHDCCSKPLDSEEPALPAEDGRLMQCCFRADLVTATKGRLPGLSPAMAAQPARDSGAMASNEAQTAQERLTADSSGDYLRFRVLRI